MINGFTVNNLSEDYIEDIICKFDYINYDKFINDDICIIGDDLYTLDNYTIVLEGYLSNKDDIICFLELNDVSIDSDLDSEIILKGYIKFKNKFIDHLRGSFSYVIYDKLNKKIIIAKDRIGSNSIYYSISNNNLFFSNKIFDILKSNDSNLNDDYLNHFISFGMYDISSKTLFKDVFSVSRGSNFIFDLNTLKFDIYNYFDIRSMCHSDDYPETISTIKELITDNRKRLNIFNCNNKIKFKKSCICLNDLYNFVDKTETIGNINLLSSLKGININYTLIQDLFYLYPLNTTNNIISISNLINKDYFDINEIKEYVNNYKDDILKIIPLDYTFNDKDKKMKINTYFNLNTYTFNRIAIINKIYKGIKFPLYDYMLIEYMYNIPYDLKWSKGNNIISNIFDISGKKNIKIGKDIKDKFNQIISCNNSNISKYFNLDCIYEILNSKYKEFFVFGEVMNKDLFMTYLVQFEYFIDMYLDK